ncbi:MAG: DNA cytosine methyltransferase [Candidatus Saccharibacteria bacterium]|nr:DNA cytosine methyltransferase [Moraxellaceae bacterium]
MNHIELFAGCGGLSLGLESVGFDLVLANELSPMAAETFAYNFFQENLETVSEDISKNKTLWLTSNHTKEVMKSRLREDPRTFPAIGMGHSDLSQHSNVDGKLIVGSIVTLNQWLRANPNITHELKNAYGRQGGLDLVSGGPPCQSFSMAGLRQLNNNRNVLPWEFAKFVGMTRPKFALLENVTGILRAFKVNGQDFYAWYEVAKAFAQLDYVPLCLHVNARFAGVAQNRPRFIFIGVRHDVYLKILPTFNNKEKQLFDKSLSFMERVRKDENIEYGFLPYHDAAKEQDTGLFSGTFLAPLVTYKAQEHNVHDAIDDLRTNTKSKKSAYINLLNDRFSFLQPSVNLKNHDLRNNGAHVQRRFRIYQIFQQIPLFASKEAKLVLKGISNSISPDAAKELLKFDYLVADGSYVNFNNTEELITYLQAHETKKQTQKALMANSPAPAALSIPDDACHYHHDELRTLTVREMARIQSFPDNFEFRSKVTTGGQMRQFEVPQYTQVGNAVPPLLGYALGKVIKNLRGRVIDEEEETLKTALNFHSVSAV